MKFAGERTRGRMDLVCHSALVRSHQLNTFGQIVKHGGNLLPTYDPTIVTHIVTDAPRPATLRVLGYKRLSEIPDHIPTVDWSWILSAIGRVGRLDKEDIKVKMEDVWLYAAFSERINTTTVCRKQLAQPFRSDKATGTSEAPNSWVTVFLSPVSSYTSFHSVAEASPSIQVRPIPLTGRQPSPEVSIGRTTPSEISVSPSSPEPSNGNARDVESSDAQHTAQDNADPLEEFYAEARAARDGNVSNWQC